MDDKTKKELVQLLDQRFDTFGKQIDQRFDTFGKQVDQRFDTFREEMHHDMISTFNQGFEEIVLPQIEEIREDVKSLKGDVAKLDVRMDRMEGKLDRLADQTNDHKNRITKLEKKAPVTPIAA